MRHLQKFTLRAHANWLYVSMAAAVMVVSVGCTGPGPRLSSCRMRCEQLVQRNNALQNEMANLAVHSGKLEERLGQAEQSLASLDRRGHYDRRRLANFQAERDHMYQHFGDGINPLPPAVHDQMSHLAARYPSLFYDPGTGVAKLDTNVLFDESRAELRPEAREMLGEFASIMRSPDAYDMRLMVVGHTDDQRVKGGMARELYPNNWHLGAGRALAVADFIRVRGVSEDRLGVSSYSKHQPLVANTSDSNRQKNRRVELFLIAPDVPVVGWTETLSTVYR